MVLHSQLGNQSIGKYVFKQKIYELYDMLMQYVFMCIIYVQWHLPKEVCNEPFLFFVAFFSQYAEESDQVYTTVIRYDECFCVLICMGLQL